ncbi:MAG: hypothetical protein DDT34_01075 [Firmicutes bacterium]|nr:hypothetical protein [Bacillota bacterium]
MNAHSRITALDERLGYLVHAALGAAEDYGRTGGRGVEQAAKEIKLLPFLGLGVELLDG